MKVRNRLLNIYGICLLGMFVQEAQGQVNSGIFYTTILAKTAPYCRATGLGKDAQAFFLKDVNGDGKDDAVAYYREGRWVVALSDGANFIHPQEYAAAVAGNLIPLMGDVNGDGKQDAVLFDPATGNWHCALSSGKGFDAPVLWKKGSTRDNAAVFLADLNGDGKADAITHSRIGSTVSWQVALSNGKDAFSNFTRWMKDDKAANGRYFLNDVNGDSRADLVIFDEQTGDWQVALSNGKSLAAAKRWKTAFGKNAQAVMVYDADRDGRADIIYCKDAAWRVGYSVNNAFDTTINRRWITGHRPATIISRGNRPAPVAYLAGNVSGAAAGACVISAGEWLVLDNPRKDTTIDAVLTDTWYAWGNEYKPQLPGMPGIYDAGDPAVNDVQIKMMHDAGFTYIMLDITNGRNDWVDDRAIKLIERIRHWNNHLQDGQHKMYFCISMGGSRSFKGQVAADACEKESARTWEEFYAPYKDLYYQMDGKPLLIHFVWEPENSADIRQFESSMPFYRKFTVRWMYNEIKDKPEYADAYGWPVLSSKGNPAGKEVMDVNPGFWNSLVGLPRDQGELYRQLWKRVLQYKPQSVWVNSFNETWEHTSVEPSWLQPAPNDNNLLATWTDYYGSRMDDFYWIMTKQYNRLFMYRQLFSNSYLQEEGSDEIYVVNTHSIDRYGTNKPRMAPVLLVPRGFLDTFSGAVINNDLDSTGYIGLKPLPYADISVAGELQVRALRNYDRLESDIYTPEKVFPERHTGASEGWPGDYEGRIILALTLQAQATHREPKYLSELIAMLPQKLNSSGYLGPVMTDSISEQQLSGHGWFLRALCEYYQWKKDPAVKGYITRIIRNLVLPTRGSHRIYPIDPAARIKHTGAAAGTVQNSIGKWQLSSDIGCDFIFMDGVIHAYTLFPSPELKALVDEMTARFLQMDLVAINAQTHATLTGLRGLLRYYEKTHAPYLLTETVKRYKLYREQAMTANYENFNWFERPEWTEPCAIVDAFMLATQLWQFTQDPLYLQDAHHIYYNALGHTQRANGGFGLDNCPGPQESTLKVLENEAYWCCTMRGGEGMAKAIQYNYFTGNGKLIVPFFNSGEASPQINGHRIKLTQESSYPFEGKVTFEVKQSDAVQPVQLALFSPAWAGNIQVRVNGKAMSVSKEKGFALIKLKLLKGTRIEYTFDMQPRLEPLVNTRFPRAGYYTVNYGPLLLGAAGNKEISFSNHPQIKRTAEKVWEVKAQGLRLTPVFHLLDPAVVKDSSYSRQVMFKVNDKTGTN